MSTKLFKFNRTNKKTNEVEAFVGLTGHITRFDAKVKENTKKTPYHSFNATVSNGEKTNKIMGQVYVGLLPYIVAEGTLPVEGEEFNFVCKVDDLKEGYNTRWKIGGTPVDQVMDGLLDELEALGTDE